MRAPRLAGEGTGRAPGVPWQPPITQLCACLAAADGRAAVAARWFGMAATTREAMGRGFSLATFRSAYDQGVAAARASLGDDAFEAARASAEA